MSGATWRSLVAAATQTLKARGVPSPRNDAEILAAHVLRRNRSALITADSPSPAQAQAFAALVDRRADREPLQHVTGVAWFRHVELEVGPGVFVPRPETELVAGVVMEEARRVAALTGRAAIVVDLCTGSGAIPAAVADEVPGAQVHAIELSRDAHAYAVRNLRPHGVMPVLGDAADAFPELDGLVDVVVSNPPYVPAGGAIRDPEVAEHDPPLALWGGPDGLDVVRVVAATAARLLRSGGLFVVEHADVQGASVPGLLGMAGPGAAGWLEVADHQDLAGRDRYCTARRAPVDDGRVER